MLKKVFLKKIFIVLILFFPLNTYAQRGCCSHHGGVSYCGDNGYYICNDGTKSSSCTCNLPSKEKDEGNKLNNEFEETKIHEDEEQLIAPVIEIYNEEKEILDNKKQEEDNNHYNESIDLESSGYYILVGLCTVGVIFVIIDIINEVKRGK